MDENAIRQWFIDCFGPIQGEMAWNQFSNMPEELRDQLMSQDVSKLPKPAEVRSMMQAFTAGGLNTFGDIQHITEEGPINVKLAKSLALQQANGEGSETSVSAEYGEMARRAISEANLWLDTAANSTPRKAKRRLLTRAGWVEGCIDSWAQFRIPDCRVDERRSGFDFVTAFRRFRIPYGNFRHFRRSGADSDSR